MCSSDSIFKPLSSERSILAYKHGIFNKCRAVWVIRGILAMDDELADDGRQEVLRIFLPSQIPLLVGTLPTSGYETAFQNYTT